jgi:hypothetical protein
MKLQRITSYEQFTRVFGPINEEEKQSLSSIKAGDESKVEVSDQKTADGKIISAQEILGQIIASATEGDFKKYFYDKYGTTKFDTETMGQMVKNYQDYMTEVAVDDKEEEKEEKKEGGGDDDKDSGDGDGGGEDPLADLGI